jgi:hypothetical protein
VTGKAHAVVASATDQRVVAEAAIDEVDASSSIEDVVLFIANDGVEAVSSGDVFDVPQRIDGDLSEGRPVRAGLARN